MAPRLRDFYKDSVAPALMKKFSYKNSMQIPKIEKIVINMGLGKLTDAGKDNKVMDEAVDELVRITGQKPVVRKAKNSIAGFKLREGVPIGCSITLRSIRMYEFLDRLISLAIPQIRDFRGVSSKAFDGRGNYTLGLRDQVIFPEIDYSKVQTIKGMNVTIVTTANTDEEARGLLEEFGIPFVKNLGERLNDS
ncbi:MAG: 50S ribosomal protein L5 [Candidatus Dadabacteria bacterium]|nr:50S ribosomal protein L5 [Candidatus Dadabacteria bacterium]